MAVTEQPLVRSGEDDAAAAAAWQAFQRAATGRAWCEHWLEYLHCSLPELGGGAVLVAGDEQAPFAPLARWPRDLDLATFTTVTEAALEAGGEHEVLLPAADGTGALALPLRIGGELQALALFRLPAPTGGEALRRQLRWSMAWLELLFLRREAAPQSPGEQAATATAPVSAPNRRRLIACFAHSPSFASSHMIVSP